MSKALYGSFLPVMEREREVEVFALPREEEYEGTRMPGAVVVVKGAGKVKLNEGRRRIRLSVKSKGDRPIQVCLDFFGIWVAGMARFRKGGADLELRREEMRGRLANGINRLARITISSRRIPSSNSTARKHMDTASISQQEHPFVSSLEIQRLSRSSRLEGTRSSVAEII